MNKEEFIDWIKTLGFTETWQTYNGEWSMYTETGIIPNNGFIFSGKVSFSFDDEKESVGVHYSKMTPTNSFGSNLGYFPLKDIGEFEKFMIVTVLSQHFDEIPSTFKSYLRDEKIKNILGE